MFRALWRAVLVTVGVREVSNHLPTNYEITAHSPSNIKIAGKVIIRTVSITQQLLKTTRAMRLMSISIFVKSDLSHYNTSYASLFFFFFSFFLSSFSFFFFLFFFSLFLSTEAAVFISAQLSTEAVSAPRKVWVLIWEWEQLSAHQAYT